MSIQDCGRKQKEGFAPPHVAFKITIILVRQNAKNFVIKIWCGDYLFFVFLREGFLWSLFLVHHNHTPEYTTVYQLTNQFY
jgi:hypothetical protein